MRVGTLLKKMSMLNLHITRDVVELRAYLLLEPEADPLPPSYAFSTERIDYEEVTRSVGLGVGHVAKPWLLRTGAQLLPARIALSWNRDRCPRSARCPAGRWHALYAPNGSDGTSCSDATIVSIMRAVCAMRTALRRLPRRNRMVCRQLYRRISRRLL